MKQQHYQCPVCGFEGLKELPFDKQNIPSYEICSCCGFEFGFESKEQMASFRKTWIARGSPWFISQARPKNWHCDKQLARLKKKNT